MVAGSIDLVGLLRKRTSRLMFCATAARKNCSRTNFSLRGDASRAVCRDSYASRFWNTRLQSANFLSGSQAALRLSRVRFRRQALDSVDLSQLPHVPVGELPLAAD